jgi:hypothetical protein
MPHAEQFVGINQRRRTLTERQHWNFDSTASSQHSISITFCAHALVERILKRAVMVCAAMISQVPQKAS